MTGLSGFAYAQARLQSRYGERADEHVWLRLHNINDLSSYLQSAQQTALRPWVLGIDPGHDSHSIELALRQKFRQHVDEVADWVPADLRLSLHWIKRLVDLPALQYLLSGNTAMDWMRLDPAINQFLADDVNLRSSALSADGCDMLLNAWRRGEPILEGWLAQWNKLLPRSSASSTGLQRMEQLLLQQLRLQSGQLGAGKDDAAAPADYEQITDDLRLIFRRNAFQPAAVCAYLAIIALDIHQLRSDLMRRLFFQDAEALAEEAQA